MRARLDRHARHGGDGAAAGAVFLVGKGVEHAAAPAGPGGRSRSRATAHRATLRGWLPCGTIVTSERVRPGALADLDADVADLAGDRRGQHQLVGRAQARRAARRARRAGRRARSGCGSASMRALGDLRVDRAQRLALGDQPLGEAFELGAAGEQGRAAVLDLALGAGALARRAARRAGSRPRRGGSGRRRACAGARAKRCRRRGCCAAAGAPAVSVEPSSSASSLLAGELRILRGELRRAGRRRRPRPARATSVTSGAPAGDLHRRRGRGSGGPRPGRTDRPGRCRRR